MTETIYLDHNATTPIDPEVADAMRPFLEGFFGNPSSSHPPGVEARRAVERARGQVAALIGCHADEVVFTSGGTESNNHAIKGVARALRERGRHIVTSAIEHPAVSEVCAFLESEGFRVTTVPVDSTGLVDPSEVERAITPSTILVSIMHANNEVGTIQPISGIVQVAHRRGVLVHSDGAQSAGKIPTRMDDLGVDLFSIAGHKLYAPKGVGALYVRRGTPLAKLVHGADHESDRRAGTENVLEIVGLGKACEIASRDLEASMARMRRTRNLLHAAITERIPDARLNGHPDHRLPNTLSVSFPGLEAGAILDALEGIAASAGAACHAGRTTVSRVLAAMGVPERVAMGTIRFSTGMHTTEREVEEAARRTADVIEGLRGGERVTLDGEVRLTHFTHGLGCACKIEPRSLEEILSRLARVSDPALLVGTETSDDAAVYRISPDLAVVSTLDFFTPIVDDPRAFGAIAAANALSDVYAMGATPLFALNIVAFPTRRLPLAVLGRILEGAGRIADLASIPVIGGHSIDDPEPKFGWAVTGTVHPSRIVRNSTAVPGDDLVLTKPLGTGIISTAAKRSAAPAPTLARSIEVMTALNREASTRMIGVAHACTDVTGFGLVGHLLEMTTSSGVAAEIHFGSVPLIEGTEELAAAGTIPGGTRDNLEHASSRVTWDPAIPEIHRLILCDAQTSGGLLVSLPPEHTSAYLSRVGGAALVGRVTGPGDGAVHVRPGGISPD